MQMARNLKRIRLNDRAISSAFQFSPAGFAHDRRGAGDVRQALHGSPQIISAQMRVLSA